MPGGFPSIGLDICNGKNTFIDEANSLGVVVTASTVPNTKGPWTTLSFSTSDVCVIRLTLNPSGGGANACAVDIGIGSSGNQVVMIPNITCNSDVAGAVSEVYPLMAPVGTNFWARAQSTTASISVYVGLTTFDGGFDQHDGINGYDSIGFKSSNTLGTQIAKSTLNAKGAWTELIAATTRDYVGFAARWDFGGNGAASGFTTFLFDIGIGSSGNEIAIVPDIPMWHVGTLNPSNQPFLPIRIPANTRISARGQSNFSTGFTCGLTLQAGFK